MFYSYINIFYFEKGKEKLVSIFLSSPCPPAHFYSRILKTWFWTCYNQTQGQTEWVVISLDFRLSCCRLVRCHWSKFWPSYSQIHGFLFLCEPKWEQFYMRDQQAFSVRRKYFRIYRPMALVTAIQLCHCSVKATKNM